MGGILLASLCYEWSPYFTRIDFRERSAKKNTFWLTLLEKKQLIDKTLIKTLSYTILVFHFICVYEK